MSNYTFDFEMTAKINADVVKEMVKKIVEEQTGKKVKSISFDVSTTMAGYGQGEHEKAIFKGIIIQFETKYNTNKTNLHSSSLASQIQSVESSSQFGDH